MAIYMVSILSRSYKNKEERLHDEDMEDFNINQMKHKFNSNNLSTKACVFLLRSGFRILRSELSDYTVVHILTPRICCSIVENLDLHLV